VFIEAGPTFTGWMNKNLTQRNIKQKRKGEVEMKKQLFFLLILVLISNLSSLAYAQTSVKPSEVIKMRLAFAGSPQPFSARAHTWWAEEVGRRTGGKVQISLHYGGSLANHSEMVKLVGSGAIDMGESVWAPYNPRVFPLHTVTDGPVIWSKRPVALIHAGMQLEKEFPEVEAENTKVNLKRLTWEGAGISGIIMRNKKVMKVEDFKGLQIRTAGKYLQPPLMKAVGAVPVGIPFPELYDSMQKGMLDGATGTMGLFIGNKLHEVCKYYIDIGIGGDPGQGIMINLDKWKSLPSDVQQVMMQLYEKDFPKVFVEQFAVPDYKRAFDIYKKAGVEIIEFPEAEKAKWKVLEPLDKHVAPWVEDTAKATGLPASRVREILERYKELADKYENIYTDVF
jgi:TRAP-type C4-dicarboxylate transport system substrate-binding protein